jgi:hypothetical protein
VLGAATAFQFRVPARSLAFVPGSRGLAQEAVPIFHSRELPQAAKPAPRAADGFSVFVILVT